MDRKNILIIALCAIVLGFTFIFLYAEKLEIIFHNWQHPNFVSNFNEGDAVSPPTIDNNDGNIHSAITDDDTSEDLIFFGDNGYLVKGALLDSSSTNIYNNLPDTIAHISFGTGLKQLNKNEHRFYEEKAQFAPTEAIAGNRYLDIYLQLAQQEKVQYLHLLPNTQRQLEVEEKYLFTSKYGSYFDPKIAWHRNMPLIFKQELLNYFQTEEGSKFTLVDDRRKIEHILIYGAYTGINPSTKIRNNDLAIILSSKAANSSGQERILVIGYPTKNSSAYILYNEAFYNTKMIMKKHSNPHTLPEEALSLNEHLSTKHDLLEVKTDNNSRFYLYYEEEFDAMRKISF